MENLRVIYILLILLIAKYHGVNGRDICTEGRVEYFCDEGYCCLQSGTWYCNTGNIDPSECEKPKISLAGFIIGLVVGGGVIAAIIIACYIRRRRRQRSDHRIILLSESAMMH